MVLIRNPQRVFTQTRRFSWAFDWLVETAAIVIDQKRVITDYRIQIELLLGAIKRTHCWGWDRDVLAIGPESKRSRNPP